MAGGLTVATATGAALSELFPVRVGLIYGQKEARLTCDGMHLEAGVDRQQAVSYGGILTQIQITGGHHSHNGASPEVLLYPKFVFRFLELGIIIVGIKNTNYDTCFCVSSGSAIVRGQNRQLIAIPGLSIQRSTQIYPAGVWEYAKMLRHIWATNGVRDVVHSGIHNPIGDPGIVARVQIAGINLNNLQLKSGKPKVRAWYTKGECINHLGLRAGRGPGGVSVYLANLWRTRFRCQRYEVILWSKLVQAREPKRKSQRVESVEGLALGS